MCPAKIPMNELKEAFHKDVIRYGHVPSRSEQNKHGTYTGTTYANRFGSWNDALKELGYPIKKHHDLIEVDCFNCGKTVKKEHNEIQNYKKSFCSQECLFKARVTDECSYCGSKYSQSYLNSGKQNGYCSDECRSLSRLALFQCDNCGDLFKSDKYTRKQYQSNYCSEKCSYIGNSRSREECLEAFEIGIEKLGTNVPLNKVMKAGGMGGGQYYRHFESLNDIARELGYEEMCGHWIIECENCGEEFKRIKSHASNNKHQFCNQECYFQWARSGALRNGTEPYNHDYGPNWYYQRRAARARDNYTCQSCGMSESQHKKEFGRRLEVHHIKKARKFTDYRKRNELCNLLTLCKKCHIKWEHLPVRPQLAD
jgi:endogenous inhibitor of DNA gyrase (YacG/DUF329 family)